MSIAKRLALALTAAIIFSAHPTPSFAHPEDNWIELYSDSPTNDESVWDYIMSWL
ncbi:MAG: hypothetical protein WA324_00380 [Bryobacteraceae bacterium]